MRVLEPKQLKTARPKHRRGVSKIFISLIILVLLTGVGLYLYAMRMVSPSQSDSTAISTTDDTKPEDDPFSIVKKPLKKLSGDGFKELFQSVAYPNTQEISDPPPITSNSAADARIRKMAEERGYRLSRIPMGAIVKLEKEPRLDTDDLLQPLAANAWYKLKDAAHRAGYPISIISAYRSPQYQRDLFLQRLYATGVTDAQLASGAGDGAIANILEITAVPGYSRHHTGYTVDFWCEDGSTSFLTSSCYKWVSADSYQNAMEYGWIPSYPEGATEQGPEPEPWEYVWVGDAVREQ